jgi:predicted DNA-binding WGR domain protein
MKPVYLVRQDERKNMHRFYHVFLVPSVFGDWAVVKEWGRVGSPGTVRKEWFGSEMEAINVQAKLVQRKQKKGYQSPLC